MRTDDLDGRYGCALAVPHAERKRFGVWESVEIRHSFTDSCVSAGIASRKLGRLVGGRYQCLSDQNLEAPDMRIHRFYETLPQRYSRFAVLR